MTTLAERIHDGRAAESDVEDLLDDWWGDVDHIATDHYDNSLEVYFETKDDVEATAEQQQAIWDMGFSAFWLNFHGGKFSGGTERAYTHPKLLARLKEILKEDEAQAKGV